MPSLVPTSEDTRIYECCVLYPYQMNQKEENQLIKDIEALFTEAGARQVAKDVWGRRGLAYPIEGAKEGNFIIYYYEMEPAKVAEVDTQLRIMKSVLRHMFVIPPKNYQIVQFGASYEQWLKERESVTQKRDREKEEKLKEAVARKAKRAVKQAEERKKEKPAAPVNEAALTEKLDKLISDDSVEL